VRVTNFLIEAVARIKEKAESFMFIRGNHDMIAGPDGVPSCCPLLKQCGVDVMADTDWNSSHLGRLHIFMVPYFRDTARQKRAFRDAWTEMTEGPKSMTTILAFHNEIKGCERNAASKGEGLTLEDIGAADYDLCVAGHIHRPQFVTPNVYFVGSPFSADWGDVNQSKRQLLVEI
jgi:DNA repair exonuclease SbcCD nuclease subunit